MHIVFEKNPFRLTFQRHFSMHYDTNKVLSLHIIILSELTEKSFKMQIGFSDDHAYKHTHARTHSVNCGGGIVFIVCILCLIG